MIDDKDERRRLAKILGEIVDSLCAKHASRKTTEPQLTSKIGQRLEDAEIAVKEALENAALGPERLPRYDIRITVQDIPDRGPGALEKPSGIDLYVNVTVRVAGTHKSKAFVVQAKKSRRRDDLADQCRKMLDRTDSAYAWIYEPDGCWVIDAKTVDDNPDTAVRDLGRKTPSDLFDAVLACTEGDPGLGLPDDEDETDALDKILEQLRAPSGISFEVSDGRDPGSMTVQLTGGSDLDSPTPS
jgi:hypothetical protein